MSWPRTMLLPAAVIAVAVLGVGVSFWLLHSRHDPTSYANARFNYQLSLPYDWTAKEILNGATTLILASPDMSAPEAVALETQCHNSPEQFGAQIFWEKQQADPAQLREAAIGNMTLQSGLSAFEAQGAGQTPYIVYTLTHDQQTCQIILHKATPLDQLAALGVLNSFRWE